MKPSKPIIIDSGIPGPTITILGGIHGNETCGVVAIDQLQNTLTLKKGKVFLIYGNTEAIEKNVRQIDTNLNRMFREDSFFQDEEKTTIEYLRSREIISYLQISDASLDLHSSPTLGSPAFIICEKNGADVVKNFPFDIRCYNFSEIEPGGTDEYMNTRGKTGICIECGNHNAPDATEKALVSIRKFLEYYEMIDTEITGKDNVQKVFTAKRAYITQTTSFRIVKSFEDFEDITCGDIIGFDGYNPVYANNTGKILFARDRSQVGVEGFVEIIST